MDFLQLLAWGFSATDIQCSNTFFVVRGVVDHDVSGLDHRARPLCSHRMLIQNETNSRPEKNVAC